MDGAIKYGRNFTGTAIALEPLTARIIYVTPRRRRPGGTGYDETR
jgi:hypothetical protein